jgi:hypothetical protein
VHARLLYAIVVSALLSLAMAGAAQAAITVANTNDSGAGSLRQAVADAPPGETIDLPAGTYTLSSEELSIEKSLTIAGHGAAETVIRSGGNFRVLDVSGAGNSVTVTDLTVSDGHEGSPGGIAEGGGILNFESSLTLRNVAVTNNHADVSGSGGGGGGIAEGGGILSEGGALALEGTTVAGNSATATGSSSGGGGGIVEGGGVAVYEGSSLTIRNTTISNNVADARGGPGAGGGIVEGGGIYLELGPSTSSNVSAVTVSGNVADASGGSGAGGGIVEGGGMYIDLAEQTAAFSNMTVASNSARAPGGGAENGGIVEGGGIILDLTNSSLTLVSATVVGNSVDAPGGIAEGGNLDRDPGGKIANSIVANGQGPPGEENCDDPLESQGFNIESSDQCGFHAAGDQVNKDPLLGPLQDNGGSIATMLPSANSPAVDQGAAFGLGSDERGVTRPIDFPTIPNSSAPGADGSDVGAAEVQPSNAFALGKLKKNKKKGTATLTVTLPLPSFGSLTLEGKGLKAQSRTIAGEETLKLPVIGKGKVKKALRKHGKRKVLIKVTYAPTGNAAVTLTRKAKLVRKHRKHRKHKKHKGNGRRHR